MRKFTYDIFDHIETPVCILSNIYHHHIGVINNIDYFSMSTKFNMNSQQELSFDVYKELDGKVCEIWDKIISLRYVYIPDHDEYYKIDVTLDEDSNVVKHLTLTSASEYELSNKIIRNLELNTEADILRQEYDTTLPAYVPNVLYNPSDPSNSILHRALADKAPDWRIAHVDASIANIQRTFSVNNQKIYDFLVKTLANEFDCLFQFNSVDRTISAYDLMNHCGQCGKRGNFLTKCPECGSTDIHEGYGRNTNIYINYNNFSEKISLDYDENAVKNCFYVTGGDDLINAAIRNCNPNGSGYIYHFSNADYEDMPPALVNRLQAYNAKYEELLPAYQQASANWYEATNEYYYYKTSMMPRTNEDAWEAQEGYNVGERVYVRTLPTWCYLECTHAGTSGEKEFDATSVVDGQEIEDGTVIWTVRKNIIDLPSATQVLNQIRTNLLSPENTIYFMDRLPSTVAIANNEVQNIAALGINNLFRVEIIEDSHNMVDADGTWHGNIKVYNTGVEDDKATSDTPLAAYLAVADNVNEYTAYIQNKVEKRLNKNDTTFTSVWKIKKDTDFKEVIKHYALDSLENFAKSYSGCIETVVNAGIKDPSSELNGIPMYEPAYKPLADRLQWVNDEIAVRSAQVSKIEKRRTAYKEQMRDIQNQLNLSNFLGETLYKTLFNYIREDSYQNTNYVSTGLSDGEQINYGKTLLELAQEELSKACELQVTLSDTVKNLLNTEEFKGYKDDFEIGDYIICSVDEETYRLRLIGIEYSYSSPEDIGLTFSNYSNIKDFFSDAQSIIDSAKTISLSYDSVVHQVDQNKKTAAVLTMFTEESAGSVNAVVSSNSMDEITFDNNGILAREFDDVTQTFKPNQMRIGANEISFTDNNWETTKVGIGKQLFKEYDTTNWELKEVQGYGVNAEYMSAGHIFGSQIISGDIYSEQYKPGSGIGSHISLDMGEFDFAGGGFVGVWHEDKGEYEINLKGNVNIAGNIVEGTKIGAWTVYEDGLYADEYYVTPSAINAHAILIDGKPISGGGGDGNAFIRQMLYEDYEQLPEEEKMDEDTLFLLTNVESEPGCVSYIPMTRSQYNTLPSSKNEDGIIRLINDEHIFYVNGVTYGNAGAGSTVSITPLISSGIKIADYEIDGVVGELLIPSSSVGGVSDVIVDESSVVVDGIARIDLTTKQDTLTFDQMPINGSPNPVTSGGVYSGLQHKQDLLTAGDNITITNNIISATDTTYELFIGATAQTSGTSGLVTAPLNTDYDKFLRGDGTWAYPSGGGGSIITITPTLLSGTKIADFSIDGVSGSLYAPNSTSGNVDDVLVDGVSVVTNKIASIDLTSKQDIIIAGQNITIGSDGKTISATDTNTDALADLTDVAFNNLSDGQILKYDENNQKWINSNGGGGSDVTITPTLSTGQKLADYSIDGTSGAIYMPTVASGDLIINPSETPTDELTKIGVSSSIEDAYLANGKIATSAGYYITCPLDKTLVNGAYTVRVRDGASKYDFEVTYSGSTITKSWSSGSNNYTLTITSTTAGMSYYSGSYRNIYCDIVMMIPRIDVYSISGGGSEVVPNPQGAATDTLNTVEIDGTIYDLPSGGGGTEVIPNPQGTATDTLNTVSIDGTIYELSSEEYEAGENISITNNVISAIDTTYTAGTNIQINAQNEISATDTTYSDFEGTDGTTVGSSGLVPAPTVTDTNKYLRSDGMWATPSSSSGGVLYGTTLPSPTIGDNGSQYVQYDATKKIVKYMYFKINGEWMPYQLDEASDAFVDIDDEPFVTEDGDVILFIE